MSKLSILMLTGLALLFGAGQSTRAATTKGPTFYVGTCKPGKADFATIQEAVSAVPPGSTINVCPGVYPEQVTIAQPLTLQGVQSGNNAQVIITAPAGGNLVATVPAAIPVIALVAISNSGGAVNISGVTVDGAGIIDSGTAVTGILYNSSPGTLNQVVVQHLSLANSQAIGIAYRDDIAASPINVVQNSSISLPLSSNSSFVRSVGIFAETALVDSQARPTSGGTITLSITSTFIDGANEAIALFDSVAATVTGNALDGTTMSNSQAVSFNNDGVLVFKAPTPIKINNNSIVNFLQGVVVQLSTGSLTVSNNNIVSSDAGIVFLPPVGASTISGNQFITPANIPSESFLVREIGIDLGCATPLPITSGNTIIGALIGLGDVPSGSSLQKKAGSFLNVPNIEQLCQ